jgi:hypothetical protein
MVFTLGLIVGALGTLGTAALISHHGDLSSNAPPTAKPELNPFDSAAFSGVYRSAKALTSATAIGVGYEKYMTLLGDFATEVSMTGDRVKGGSPRGNY